MSILKALQPLSGDRMCRAKKSPPTQSNQPNNSWQDMSLQDASQCASNQASQDVRHRSHQQDSSSIARHSARLDAQHSIRKAGRRNVHKPSRHSISQVGRIRSRFSFAKSMIRMWFGHFARFLTLAIIAMLGVSMLAGIYAGCRDMLVAINQHYQASKLYDISVAGTLGLTDDDVQALLSVDGVDDAQGERSATRNVLVDNAEHMVEFRELPEAIETGMNVPYAIDGQLPDSDDEVAVTQSYVHDYPTEVGDVVTVIDPETQLTRVGTVSGIVIDPKDLTNPEGYQSTNFRSTVAQSYTFFVSHDALGLSEFTSISVRLVDSDAYDTFSTEYELAVSRVIESINSTVRQWREDERREQLLEQIAFSYGVSMESVEDQVGTSQWYVTSRTSMENFSSMKSDLLSIRSIGYAFPVIFLLVAIMMSLTTISRLVQEDRGLIGTYMALGYGKFAIALRYVLFAILSSALGGAIGELVGFLGIPAFLLVILQGLYTVPNITLLYDWGYGSVGIAIFVVGMMIAAVVACMEEMRQMPSVLMRPKAPKSGSRVLLEYIRPLWRRLSFLNKVTIRNLFRFKGRLIMTIAGVAGCTALIISGLAMNDTVASLGKVQYGEIYQYDVLAVSADSNGQVLLDVVENGYVEDNASSANAASADEAASDVASDDGDHAFGDAAGDTEQTAIANGDSVETVLPARIESGSIATIVDESDQRSFLGIHWRFWQSRQEQSTSIQLVIVDDVETLSQMITMRSTDNAEAIELSDDGVIVEQSVAHALGIEANSQVTLSGSAIGGRIAKVSAVMHNLIGLNVYMTRTYYEEVFGSDAALSADNNAAYMTLNCSREEQKQYAADLVSQGVASTAFSTAKLEDDFSFDLMSAVVALIVAFAGALALVVLCTLMNTNISERSREMATLKVLGFTPREVHRYVHREMLSLTFLGILVGLPCGRGVAQLLTSTLKMPGMYFDVSVNLLSYGYAVLATIIFALFVQWGANPVLDRIDPVSSLKSVE